MDESKFQRGISLLVKDNQKSWEIFQDLVERFPESGKAYYYRALSRYYLSEEISLTEDEKTLAQLRIVTDLGCAIDNGYKTDELFRFYAVALQWKLIRKKNIASGYGVVNLLERSNSYFISIIKTQYRLDVLFFMAVNNFRLAKFGAAGHGYKLAWGAFLDYLDHVKKTQHDKEWGAQLEENVALAYRYLAKATLKMGEYEWALEYSNNGLGATWALELRNASSFRSISQSLKLSKAQALFYLEEYGTALAFATGYIDERQDEVEAWRLRAKINFALRCCDAAIKDCWQAIAFDAEHDETLRLKDAINELRQAFLAAPAAAVSLDLPSAPVMTVEEPQQVRMVFSRDGGSKYEVPSSGLPANWSPTMFVSPKEEVQRPEAVASSAHSSVAPERDTKKCIVM
ncbi:MAG: hypothetical protein SFW07_07050 [Gammaproteobacteria bacterium]|nr:hypothetical protein [Gammaproteobacteria bacterium]